MIEDLDRLRSVERDARSHDLAQALGERGGFHHRRRAARGRPVTPVIGMTRLCALRHLEQAILSLTLQFDPLSDARAMLEESVADDLISKADNYGPLHFLLYVAGYYTAIRLEEVDEALQLLANAAPFDDSAFVRRTLFGLGLLLDELPEVGSAADRDVRETTVTARVDRLFDRLRLARSIVWPDLVRSRAAVRLAVIDSADDAKEIEERPASMQMNPVMQAAADFITAHPGSSLAEVAAAIGRPYESFKNHLWKRMREKFSFRTGNGESLQGCYPPIKQR